MPKLPPTMTGARILKWHLTAPGDHIILEIEADNLVDEGSRSTLEIEQRPQMLCPYWFGGIPISPLFQWTIDRICEATTG